MTAVTRRTLAQHSEDLGHVIYAIGLTGDFRERLFETIDAHVSTFAGLLQAHQFQSCLYLSSARIYGADRKPEETHEGASIKVLPGPDSLYDLSKMLGEALSLSQSAPTVRVARLSNVYGPRVNENTFLGSILRDLKMKREVTIGESPESAKDYVALSDVVGLLEAITIAGHERVYNVASGRVVTHRELAENIRRVGGHHVAFSPGAPTRTFPAIEVSKVRQEFGYSPRKLLDDLPSLLRA